MLPLVLLAMAAPRWQIPKRAAEGGEATGAPPVGKAKPATRSGGAQPAAASGGAPSGGDAAAEGGGNKTDKQKRNRHLGRVKDMGWNKKQAGLINVMLKQLLLTTQMVRDLWAAGVDTFFMDADSPEVVAALDSGATYSQEVRARGKGHQLGPPHLHIFNGFLAKLLERGVALGQRTHSLLKLWYDKMWVELGLEEIYNILRLFRVMKCFDPTKRKIHIMLREVPMETPSQESDEQQLPSPTLVRSLLQKALVEVGARRAMGAAPPGAMEEIIQNAVDAKEVA